MLSSILSKRECAECKFCCSFRRKSLWETPVFTKKETEKLQRLYSGVQFRPVGNNSFTFDISGKYKTDDSEEEAPCPFLDSKKGCILHEELKPFDCKIWPLRAVKIKADDSSGAEKLAVALTPTCPAINKVPLEKVRELVNSGLGKKILAAARQNPDMVKEYSDFFCAI